MSNDYATSILYKADIDREFDAIIKVDTEG